MKRFIIKYLDGSFKFHSPSGCSLPVKADDKEHAVRIVFGGNADEGSWDGNEFTMFKGSQLCEALEIAA